MGPYSCDFYPTSWCRYVVSYGQNGKMWTFLFRREHAAQPGGRFSALWRWVFCAQKQPRLQLQKLKCTFLENTCLNTLQKTVRSPVHKDSYLSHMCSYLSLLLFPKLLYMSLNVNLVLSPTHLNLQEIRDNFSLSHLWSRQSLLQVRETKNKLYDPLQFVFKNLLFDRYSGVDVVLILFMFLSILWATVSNGNSLWLKAMHASSARDN